MSTTQLSLPSVDALREQFANSTPEPTQAPAQPPQRPQGGFRRGASAARQEAAPKKERKPNAYGGDCWKCGGFVPEGSGYLGQKVNGRWTVEHREDECSSAVSTKTEATADGEQPVTIDPRNPYPGIYTVEDEEGHVTLRVWQQPLDPDDGFAPGALIMEHLIGRDNESDYKRFAFVKGGRLQVWNHHKVSEGQPEKRYVRAARVLLENPESVLTAKNCPRCNAILSNPVSLAAGIGPDCKKAWGW